jgi:hypothetical protein
VGGQLTVGGQGCSRRRANIMRNMLLQHSTSLISYYME